MLFGNPETNAAVYNLLGAKYAREENDAMPTMRMDERLEQFFPRFGTGLIDEVANGSDQGNEVNVVEENYFLNSTVSESEDDSHPESQNISQPTLQAVGEQSRGDQDTTALVDSEDQSNSSQRSASPAFSRRAKPADRSFHLAEVEIQAPALAQTLSPSLLELHQSQAQANMPSNFQQNDERGLQSVEEVDLFGEEALSDDPADNDSAYDNYLNAEALNGGPSAIPMDLDSLAVIQSTEPPAPQAPQLQSLAVVPPPPAGQHIVPPVTQRAVADPSPQNGQPTNSRPGKGAWTWSNRRGPKPATGVLTPYDFVRDKQAYLQNKANYDKAHALIAKCPFKYGCKSGPFSTRVDGLDDFVAIITLNQLNKYRKTVPAYRDQPTLNGHAERKNWYDNQITKAERDEIRVFVMERVEEEIATTHPAVWAEVKRLRQLGGGQAGTSVGMASTIPQLGGGPQPSVAGGQSGRVLNLSTTRPNAPRSSATRRGTRANGARGGDSDVSQTIAAPRATSRQLRKKSRKSAQALRGSGSITMGTDDTMESMQPGPFSPAAPFLRSDLGNNQGFSTPGMQQSGFEYHHAPILGLNETRQASFSQNPPNLLQQVHSAADPYDWDNMHAVQQDEQQDSERQTASAFNEQGDPHSQQLGFQQPMDQSRYQASMTQSSQGRENGYRYGYLPAEMLHQYPDPEEALVWDYSQPNQSGSAVELDRPTSSGGEVGMQGNLPSLPRSKRKLSRDEIYDNDYLEDDTWAQKPRRQ